MSCLYDIFRIHIVFTEHTLKHEGENWKKSKNPYRIKSLKDCF
jgi:hypothetical protein